MIAVEYMHRHVPTNTYLQTPRVTENEENRQGTCRQRANNGGIPVQCSASGSRLHAGTWPEGREQRTKADDTINACKNDPKWQCSSARWVYIASSWTAQVPQRRLVLQCPIQIQHPQRTASLFIIPPPSPSGLRSPRPGWKTALLLWVRWPPCRSFASTRRQCCLR